MITVGRRSEKLFFLVSSLFATVLVLSNIASSAKIVDLGVSLFGLPLAFDGGTLLFPFSYIIGDILAEVYGFKTSRKVIWTGFFCLALSSLLFRLLAALPGEAEWQGYAGDAAFDAILGGMKNGALTLASLAGYLVGEMTNSLALVKIKKAMNGRLLPVRTIVSTLIGEFLDSFIFTLIAVAGGVFPKELFWTLVITNYVLKCALEILVTPITCLSCACLKK